MFLVFICYSKCYLYKHFLHYNKRARELYFIIISNMTAAIPPIIWKLMGSNKYERRSFEFQHPTKLTARSDSIIKMKIHTFLERNKKHWVEKTNTYCNGSEKICFAIHVYFIIHSCIKMNCAILYQGISNSLGRDLRVVEILLYPILFELQNGVLAQMLNHT